MKALKRMLIVLAAVMLMLPMTAFAASSPAKKSLSKASASAKTVTYTGKDQKAKLTVKYGKTTLKEGKDFKIVSKKTYRNAAGTTKITIKGIGKYTGTKTVSFTVKKGTQTIKVAKAPATVKYSDLKKKSKSFTMKVDHRGKAKNAKVSYKASSKDIKISKDGKVTFKKGMKKGTYKITITTKETPNFKAGKKTITIKVK